MQFIFQKFKILKKIFIAILSIRSLEALLDFDYGDDKAWVSLKDQCAELTTTQYIYRLCLFDRAIQKDRNGHSEISLG